MSSFFCVFDFQETLMHQLLLSAQASSPPTSLSTSNHSHQRVFRGEVLRRILRLLWPMNPHRRYVCPLLFGYLSVPTAQMCMLTDSNQTAENSVRFEKVFVVIRDRIVSKVSHPDMSVLLEAIGQRRPKIHLRTTPRSTHWCKWLVVLAVS